MKDEVSMYEVLQVFLSRWKILVIFALFCIFMAIIKHKKFPTYPARGKLLIKTSENSQLRSFLDSIVGSPQNINPAERALIILETNNFYLAIADHLYSKKFKSKIVKNYLLSFKKDQQKLASSIRSKLRFQLKKGGQIFFSVKTNRKQVSVMIVNQSLIMAKKYLISSELKEYIEAESYFKKQIDHTLNNLNELSSSSVKKMQKGKILSINAEKGEGSKYLSRLKQQINDTRIKIAQNKSIIRNLRKKLRKTNMNYSKFGALSRIKQLLDENSSLYIKIKTNRRYLNKIGNKKLKLVPFQQEMEKIKANYHFEFKIYEGLRDKLAKIGLQKTYIKNKIDILEFERLNRVKSKPGLVLLILIGFMISQVIGFTLIYLFELFKPVEVNNKFS